MKSLLLFSLLLFSSPAFAEFCAELRAEEASLRAQPHNPTTQKEIEARFSLMEKAAAAVNSALVSGVAPGHPEFSCVAGVMVASLPVDPRHNLLMLSHPNWKNHHDAIIAFIDANKLPAALKLALTAVAAEMAFGNKPAGGN